MRSAVQTKGALTHQRKRDKEDTRAGRPVSLGYSQFGEFATQTGTDSIGHSSSFSAVQSSKQQALVAIPE
jgi:hypothetical protein